MMITTIKTFTFVILAVLPAVQLIRDWKFHDRRTRRYHTITRVLLIAWIILCLLSGVFYYTDLRSSQKRINKTQNELNNIKQYLEPIICRTIQNYPGEAREIKDRWANEAYSPQLKIAELMNQCLQTKMMSRSDITRMIVLTKQLIEFKQEIDLYPVLHFWCNWYLSAYPSQSYTSALMLKRATEIMTRDEKDFPDQLCDLAGLKKLHDQFEKLYEAEGFSLVMFSYVENWHALTSQLLREVLGKPIEMPDNIDSNNDDPILKLHREAREIAKTRGGEKWEFHFIRKMRLVDDKAKETKGKEGEIFLEFQSKPNVTFITELEPKYDKKDFLPSPKYGI